MSFQPIRNTLKSKLEAIDSIQEVADYPTETFNGFPAAMVVSTRNESEFQTTIENKRIYVFTIYLIQIINEDTDMRKTRRIIEGVVDDVIEAFDKDQLLSGVDLPNNETLIIVQPALSEVYIWQPASARYMVAEMEVGVTVQFNIGI